MKKFLASLLLFIVLVPGMGKFFYIAYWNINQEALTKAYCKNQDKPELECNGQCHLEETLEKIDEGNNNDTEKNIPCWEKLAENLVYNEDIVSPFTYHNPFSIFHIQDKKHFYYSNSYHFSKLNSIFHPPCFG
jgi:hypothetical protein